MFDSRDGLRSRCRARITQDGIWLADALLEPLLKHDKREHGPGKLLRVVAHICTAVDNPIAHRDTLLQREESWLCSAECPTVNLVTIVKPLQLSLPQWVVGSKQASL